MIMGQVIPTATLKFFSVSVTVRVTLKANDINLLISYWREMWIYNKLKDYKKNVSSLELNSNTIC